MAQMNNVSWPGWETVRVIGTGSFGQVYEIRRDMFGREEKAALKVLSIPSEPGEIEELYNEGYDDESVTAHLQNCLQDIVQEYSLMFEVRGHSNVVYCDDLRYVRHTDDPGWDIFIKMELLQPLNKVIKEFDEQQIIRIGMDICTALKLCRQKNIVHRDIKPQNIFVSNTGDFKLGDFGVAKVSDKTSGGTKVGTFEYMAPEVYNNQPYGAAADIYSLGLVMYWLMNEHRGPWLPMPPQIPTGGMKEDARRRRFGGETLPAPAHGSEGLKQIVLKACAFDPRNRYGTAEQMLEELDALRRGGTSHTAATADEIKEEGTYAGFRRPGQSQQPSFDQDEKTTGIFTSKPQTQTEPVDKVEEPAYKPAQPVYQPPVQQPVYQPPVQQPVYQPPVQQTVYQAPAQQTVETRTAPQFTPIPEKKKSKKGWIAGAVALVLVILAAIGSNAEKKYQQEAQQEAQQTQNNASEVWNDQTKTYEYILPSNDKDKSSGDEKLSGWQSRNGNTYYYDEITGDMMTGWQKISGKTYYFGTDGVMRTEGKYIDGSFYYFGSDGAMRTGEVEISGKGIYYFDSTGKFTHRYAYEPYLNSTISDVKATFSNSVGDYWTGYFNELSDPVENCTSLKCCVSDITADYGDPNGTWALYVRKSSGEWKRVAEFTVANGEASQTVTFDEPLSFSAFKFFPYDVYGLGSYSCYNWLEDVMVLDYDFE